MNNNYITIQINGEPFNCSYGMSLHELVSYFNIDSKLVLVEYNTDIIHENCFNTIVFKHNDKLEIITVVGGG